MASTSLPTVETVSPLSNQESSTVVNTKEVTVPAYSDEKIFYEPEPTANDAGGKAKAGAKDAKDEKIV
jgi:hypothetical protein